LSDSVHDLGDALVIGASWWLERRSMTEADKRHTYGYRRYSVLSALVTTVVLLLGSMIVLMHAIPRLLFPQPVDDTGMLVFAVLGILLNGIATWKTHGGESMSQRAVSLHMLEDVLGWVAVLVGAAIIKLTGWYIIDY
jgi:cobalt-zinc-cadmium efflux system protein